MQRRWRQKTDSDRFHSTRFHSLAPCLSGRESVYPDGMPQVLEHVGPHMQHEPVAKFCAISERAFSAFHEAISGHERQAETPRQHLVTRMTYIAETTSTVVRLSTTWALSMPGMSLVRDRYEQAVRFSWLARQSDNAEMVMYIGSYYAKTYKVFRDLPAQLRSELAKMNVEFPPWMAERPTREQQAYLDRWQKLDLISMATKRDALPPPNDTPLARESLGDLYAPIYRQFCSVTHYDMYGVNMLSLHAAPDGKLVLAPDPWWPAILCAYNALFDLIQCHDALTAFFKPAPTVEVEQLFLEWQELNNRLGQKDAEN